MRRFRLSPAQETILLEAMSDPARYTSVLRYNLSKSINIETLDSRLALIADRHEVLRTTFIRDSDGVLRQEVTDRIDSKLFRIELRGSTLTVTFHHALLDGWSIGIIMRELLTVPDGIAPPFRYYAKWLSQRDYSSDLNWWKLYLNGKNAATALPNVLKTSEYERRELRFTVPNPDLLRRRASELKITVGRLLQSVWCMLTARYNGGESVVCTVNAGRSAPIHGITGMVGMCLNTLPIVTKLPKPPISMPFADWVSEWSGQTAEAEKHGFCALGDLVNAMPHLLTVEPSFDGEGYTLQSSTARLVTDFDAVFTLGGEITIEFAYNACAYSEESVGSIRGHFLTALDAVLNNPRLPVERIPVLTDAEASELTAPNENKEILERIETQTVSHLWQESAKAHAERTALVCGDARLTYSELEDAVNRVSSALTARGVKAETSVAILLPRSERYVIAELAVMASGGLFIPLDPEWPQDRLQLILNEINPHTVIDEKMYAELTAHNCPLSIVHCQLPSSAAYTVMTSGTTGVPKGVVATHRGLANFCLWVKERYGWRPGDACALVLNFSFDASFWDIFPPLISGGTLHILRDGIRFNIGALGAYCKAERITHLNLPVTVTDSFREAYRGENALPDLRVMATGNEEVRQVVTSPYPLSNEYGPTECTVACSAGWIDEGAITVGSPVPNMSVRVLDEWGRLCPDGVTGEAVFTGVQVARGYYGGVSFDGAYSTGDLMAWVRNGQKRELAFKGRADTQVKINGFRVELGEIESALRSHPRVKAVHAAVRGTDKLCAYVVGNAGVSELDALLASKLPFYMRPAVILVETIPLNANGKVDLESLPFPEARHTAGYSPPVTDAEKALVSAVSLVLNVERIGRHDNYLALGGNSINAMRIAFRLEAEGWALAAKDLILSGSLAEAAEKTRPVTTEAKENFSQDTFTPLAAQQAMFFLTETEGLDMYAITLKVNARGLDPDTLKSRLDRAVGLHDILRSTFERDGQGRILGRVHDVPTVPAVSAELRGGELTLRYHHIALDGHGVSLLLDELLYGKFPDTAPSFAAFANRLAGQAARRQADEAWWREQCVNAAAAPLLSAKPIGKRDFKRIKIPAGGLPDAAKRERVTTAAFAMAAWGVVLNALNAWDGGSLLIPFIASCRDHDGLMGMCAAARPLKVDVGGGTFGELARQVQNAMLESISHWFVPQELIGKLPRYLFVYETGTGGFSADGEQNYDLVVKVSDKIEFIYNAACVRETQVREIAEWLSAALSTALDDRVSIFREGEYERITQTFAHGRALDSANYRIQKTGTGDIVPICLPRGEEGVTAQIEAARSGAAFCPLDPEWPAERRLNILNEIRDNKVPPDTAYVLYTSGTTGKPKGAVIPQSALANQIAWAIDEFKLCSEDKILHYVSFAFDPSVWTIFAAQYSGAALSVIPNNLRLDPEAAAQYIREHNITVCVLPASAAPEILRFAGDSKLRLVFLGGEPVKNLPPDRTYEVINCYGPTETCVNATFYRIPPKVTETRNIGKPVANTDCYVLDKSRNPCPIGIQGELYIGGVQLARGYLNRPDETAAAFTEHPQFGRLYKTGDFAAWNQDGTLEFLGRRDGQVKIRGHRVELTEIEAALCGLPDILDARVKFFGGNLDAYVVGDADGARQRLSEKLPSHMIPRSVTAMDAFPLTENGKVDLSALPEPRTKRAAGRELSETEAAVAAAWSAALNLPADFAAVPDDNFNELGGHSLLLFHVVGLLAANGITADIRTLIDHPVLEDLAAAIGRRPRQEAVPKAESAGTAGAKDYKQYVQKTENLGLTETRLFRHVMITGGTGFLGSHLVREFYANTDAVLHLPVRNDTKKLNDALGYYFGDTGREMAASDRLRVYRFDISQVSPYTDAPLDAIFHTAADIRHYAPEAGMLKANVTATENMIEAAKRNPSALFAHISTTSAVNAPVIHECDAGLGPDFENIYQRTKQIAEQSVFTAGESGLNYVIFRIGHVSPGFESGSVARNWEINAMLRLLNAMLLTELLPERDYKIGFGYADKVALCIRLLATPVNLERLVFHIDNPNALRLSELFKLSGLNGQILPKDELTARLRLLTETGAGPVKQAASEYLGRLAQGGLEKDSADIVAGELHMDATLRLLKRLGFEWPHVTAEYMQAILRHLKGGMTYGQ